MSTEITFAYDIAAIEPLLVLTLGALLLLMLEVFSNREWPRGLVTGTFLIAALALLVKNSGSASAGATVFSGLVYFDPFSVYFTVVLLAGSTLAILLSEGRLDREGITSPGEFYSLYLMSTIGAIIFVSAAELITLFLGLEIMSMALYCLCGSAVRLRRSAESAMKYFFLGSFSSAFLLYGIALLYGLTGTTSLEAVAGAASSMNGPLLYVALGLMLVGFVFKIGAVPFHFWAPDVYQGAPTPVTAYMACVIKASAVGAALRVLWTTFPTADHYLVWSGAVWIIAVITMILGNLVALRQRSMKRMLAYSSIGHAGYIMVGFLAPNEFGGGAAVLYYIVAYTVMTMGAFGVVLAVTQGGSEEEQSDDISNFNRLGYRQPLLAGVMTLFLLALAGLPPGMAGFVGKFFVFNAAVKADFVGLAIIGVLCSAVSVYYYLRVVVAMYFVPESEAPDDSLPQSVVTVGMAGALAVCGIAILALGMFPSWLYDGAARVMAGL